MQTTDSFSLRYNARLAPCKGLRTQWNPDLCSTPRHQVMRCELDLLSSWFSPFPLYIIVYPSSSVYN